MALETYFVPKIERLEVVGEKDSMNDAHISGLNGGAIY